MGKPSGVNLEGGIAEGHNYLGDPNVYAVGSDGNVWQSWFTPGTGWSSWTSMGAPSSTHLLGSIAAGSSSAGHPEIVAAGADGNVWQSWFTPGVGWSSWSVQGGISKAPVSLADGTAAPGGLG
jgi:hypothetical protein